jgi:hypothetical protein
MADIYEIWNQLVEEGVPDQIVRSPMLQFGTERRPYLGATLLPERQRTTNEFTETKITYKSFPALDGTRYSEPKMQGQQLVGSFSVKLGEIDTAAQLTGYDLDAIIEIASDNPIAARNRLIQWVTGGFGVSLAEKEEIQRWQAFVDAAVPIQGMDGNSEVIQLPNPEGHRTAVPSGTTAAPTGWYGDDYDPMEDIDAVVQLFADKGYVINRIIGDTQVMSCVARNPVMRERLGAVTFPNNTPVNRIGAISRAAINTYLQSDWGLPPIEIYDLTYSTMGNARQFFKKRGALVFVCTTGRDEMLETGTDDAEVEVIPDTLGYYAIGRAVGQTSSGRVVETEVKTMKPPGIYGQGFQTSFPVVTEPEAIAVLQIDKPTPA